ncbi:MAG: hypothetical protein WBG20_06130 [Candidatus Deferrimicrobiaceae bacterium]
MTFLQYLAILKSEYTYTDPLAKPTDKKREIRRRKEVAGRGFRKKQNAFRDERTSISPVGRLGVIHE